MTYRESGIYKIAVLFPLLVFSLADQKAAYAEEPPPAEIKIYTPMSEIEKAAQTVLEQHCSRCHQEGRLVGRTKPAKEFGNVLQLDQLLADPAKTKPGNPDGSRIFQLIVNGQMPQDVADGYSMLEGPTPDDIQLLRTWIDNAGQVETASCSTADGDYGSQYDLIAGHLGSLPEHRRAGARYISLSNLAATCFNADHMEAYRYGLVKLLNSLSSMPDPVQPVWADEDRTILQVNLEDLGWSHDLWATVTQEYPYGVRPLAGQYKFVTSATGTAIPLIRGDWLAFYASRPPLYNKILDLPPTFQELQTKLGLDVGKNIADYRAQRAGFQKSGVSENNRLIERHPISTGAFWTSYDFGGNGGRQSLFQFPLGPGGEFGFNHDGGETIFNLPNGYQAYYLNTAKGDSIDKGPTNIVRDKSRRDLAVTNGISCMGCHNQGMRNAKDEIRSHVETSKILPVSAREAVLALFPTSADMDKLIEADRARFQTAVKNSGIDPTKDLNGVEVINALSNKYEQEIDIKVAAAEFGVASEDFGKKIGFSGPMGANLLQRLEQGTIQRDEFESAYGSILERVVDAEYIKPSRDDAVVVQTKVSSSAHEFASAIKGVAIQLNSDKLAYVLGDKIAFSVKVDRACHLTLVDQDSNGETTIIFPNQYQQDNLIQANQTFLFPNEKSSFDFKLSTRGTETVIAICDESGKALGNIPHDFAASLFTDLGKGETAYRKIDVVPKESRELPPIGRSAIKLTVE